MPGVDGEQPEGVAGVRQTHMSFEWSDGSGESDFNQLLGKRVRIVGLTGRPELNGCIGAYALHTYTEHPTRHVPARACGDPWYAVALACSQAACIAGTRRRAGPA